MFCNPLHQKDTEQAAWPTSALLFSIDIIGNSL
jgi:hypothetical protein